MEQTPQQRNYLEELKVIHMAKKFAKDHKRAHKATDFTLYWTSLIHTFAYQNPKFYFNISFVPAFSYYKWRLSTRRSTYLLFRFAFYIFRPSCPCNHRKNIGWRVQTLQLHIMYLFFIPPLICLT